MRTFLKCIPSSNQEQIHKYYLASLHKEGNWIVCLHTCVLTFTLNCYFFLRVNSQRQLN